MEHPHIKLVNQTGYVEKQNIYGTDFKGNEVYYGDEIYIHEEDFWLADEAVLSSEERQLLEHFGAKKIIANNRH
ncbi:hypothetical protein [Gracilibacillus alcaliphilus]|uniref:hypothetical protein n=1 Tax=Gracilibacillus alcaliphilus TaxID=1401441 RepID=UPI00195D08A3|nr:hypothetical protein [Gracilibacillus alcaliphilus]MBM7679556.1 hypothetical protein [Gracilibacillus alcaliphilus]